MSRRDADQEPRPPGLRGATRVLLERELDLAWGGGGGPLLACGFFACLTAILPLAAGGDPRTLGPVAGGVAWLALALASTLSLERLFERDFEDGALDLIALGAAPLELVVVAKAKAQWLAVGAPLALSAPVAAIALGLPTALTPLTALTALIGSLGFALTGALGASLLIGVLQTFAVGLDPISRFAPLLPYLLLVLVLLVRPQGLWGQRAD